MKRIEIQVNPYHCGSQITRLTIDGIEVMSNVSRLTTFVVRKNMYEWLTPFSRGFQKWEGILPEFVRELNDDTFDITFIGRVRDYPFFRDAVASQQESLMRRGMQTNLSQRFVPLGAPAGMVNSVKDLLKDFIETVVQRLDGDCYEGLKALRDKMSVFPVALDDLSGMADELPGMLKERGAVLWDRGIRVIVLDGAKTARDLQEDLLEVLGKDHDEGNPFILICLIGDSAEQAQKKCMLMLEQINVRSRISAVCAIAADADQCASLFDNYLNELYLPFVASEVTVGMFRIAEQLKNRYEDAYIFQIYNDIRDLQESMT